MTRRLAPVTAALLVALLGASLASPARAEDPADAPPAPPLKPEQEGADLGLSLFGGGAALLAGTAAGFVLLEAVTTPDDNRNPQQYPELVQAGGFAALTLASLSAGLMLLGGGLLLEENLERPAPPAAAP